MLARLKEFRLLWLGGLVLAVTAAVSPGIRVRLEILALKAEGELPEVSKWDLVPLIRPHSGFDLDALLETRSPYSSLLMPARFEGDSARGAVIFASHCAVCHGAEARGGMGPSLASADLRHGASDWAMFRTVRDGIPGTGMRSLGLSFDDAWRAIALIRSLQRAGTAAAATPVGQAADRAAPIADHDLATADSRDDEWVTYAGGWRGHRNKSVPELTRTSIQRLHLAWAYQLRADPVASQSTPIAARGLLIVTTATDVVALDQRNGDVVWRFHRDLPLDLKLCCLRANRGVAVYGHAVFFGTLDAHLISLDLGTGALRWDIPVARRQDGASITGAPLVADGKLIIGISGSEFGARGFLDAYRPEDGTHLWRFYTIPAAGEPGSQTWPSDRRAALGGGGGAWVTGAYDPNLRLLYWGVGNPSPAYAPDTRPGNNLHTCSVIALDIDSGTLKWSYQFTPNDSHDWDAGQSPILTDAVWQGKKRQLILWANKNAFFYVLDRATGEFLRATPFAKQTWNDGFDSLGNPRVRAASLPTPKGVLVYPGNAGATNWWPPTYSEGLGLLYVPVWDGGGWFFRDPHLDRSDGLFTGGRVLPVPGERAQHLIVALDVATGQARWRAPLFTLPHGAKSGGLLGVGDRLVLGSEESSLVAFDARTGERVWQENLGGDIGGAPMVFRVDGKPRLAVTAGAVLFVFDLGGPATLASRGPAPPRMSGTFDRSTAIAARE